MLMDTPSDERGPSHVGNPDFDHRLNYFYDVFFQHFQHDYFQLDRVLYVYLGICRRCI